MKQTGQPEIFSGETLKDKLLHPNALTFYRIVAIPGLILLMNWPNRVSSLLAGLLFSVAAITDYLDGWYARKLGLVSNFGKIMDPLADKLLVSSALIMLAAHGRVAAWIVCVIIGREIAVTGLRNFIAEQRLDLSASDLGKYKTGFQIAAIIPLLIHFNFLGLDAHAIGIFFIWCALFYTVWSGVDYFYRFREVF